MKIFFDSNIYVAEAIRGRAAARMIEATRRARWRIYASQYLLDEVSTVLTEDLKFGPRVAFLTVQRIRRRAVLLRSTGKAVVPGDPADSPILRAALAGGVDFLVTNDRHLLELDPFHGLRIISMTKYHRLLRNQGML